MSLFISDDYAICCLWFPIHMISDIITVETVKTGVDFMDGVYLPFDCMVIPVRKSCDFATPLLVRILLAPAVVSESV